MHKLSFDVLTCLKQVIGNTIIRSITHAKAPSIVICICKDLKVFLWVRQIGRYKTLVG